MPSRIPPEIKERLTKLRETINRHRYLYHVKNTSEISDEALDSLKRELVEIEKKYPELITPDSPSQRVAGAPLKEFIKIKHIIPQWSFNDAFTEEDIRDFDGRVKRFLGKSSSLSETVQVTYTTELKIDGLKVVLEYREGKLFSAATRGDGVVGEDVTMNVRTIESVPLLLAEPSNIIVEGEVWLPKKEFERINKDRAKKGEPLFANPRNMAAGTIRQLDQRMVAGRKLDIFIYDIASYGGVMPETQTEELEFLAHLGFKVNSHAQLCATIEEVIEYWKFWHDKKDKQEYLIDGVVVKVSERKYQ
jgi:DNA ligase (NAD+)